ncbi:MAG: hypothetical protein E6K80_10215 [Candidatus Eisenbacteria bacterium]|uniref:HEAT repeat domain-containing protein n=1 Tax=Eiseniibacteriota bacterium TaxID=2212470 RepID=A0A538U219_UNCEI|nr:MAG: hypothetical protein E6K80_10215 [Candidatus Eisenbacteria bacterium]
MAGLTVLFHRVMHWRAERLERRVQSLAGSFALHLTGGVPTTSLRQISDEASEETFWAAIQRFSDNVGGDEWLWLSRQLGELVHLRNERRRLRRARPWRQAVAARRLGMVDDPRGLEALLSTLDGGRPEVRLRALLSLARLQDPHGLRWLVRHPQLVQDAAPSIVLAMLKRFGSGYTPEIRDLVAEPGRTGRLVVAWKRSACGASPRRGFHSSAGSNSAGWKSASPRRARSATWDPPRPRRR